MKGNDWARIILMLSILTLAASAVVFGSGSNYQYTECHRDVLVVDKEACDVHLSVFDKLMKE